MKVFALLAEMAAALSAVGIEEPAREARRLLQHATGLDAAALLAARDRTVAPAASRALLARRLAREPMAYILGRRGFWTLDLAVTTATLIPRPESETLIEAALAFRPERAQVRQVLDLGTGTGCLLLAALAEFPLASGVGLDRSAAAARVAQANAAAAGFTGRARFVVGNWGLCLSGGFDLVLCNPPYVAERDRAGLAPELGFEPAEALFAGADGLAAYRRLLPGLTTLLAPGGLAVVELGTGQAAAVAVLAAEAGLDPRHTRYDLGGTARALVLEMAAQEKRVGTLSRTN